MTSLILLMSMCSPMYKANSPSRHLRTWEQTKMRGKVSVFVCLKHGHKTLTLSAHKTLSKHFATSYVKFAGVNSRSKMTTRKKNKSQHPHRLALFSPPNGVFSDPRPWISGITLSNAAEWELLANRLAPSQPPSSHVVIVRVRLGCSLFLPLSFSFAPSRVETNCFHFWREGGEGNGARPHLPFGSSRASYKQDRRERERATQAAHPLVLR